MVKRKRRELESIRRIFINMSGSCGFVLSINQNVGFAEEEEQQRQQKEIDIFWYGVEK